MKIVPRNYFLDDVFDDFMSPERVHHNPMKCDVYEKDGLYNIDLTWDDQEDRIIYNYFNLSESIITIDHKRDEVSSLLPKALGTKYINSSSPMMKKNK